MNAKNIAAVVAGIVVFLLFPHQMGGALGTMALWFSLVYFGYKGSFKTPPLSSPFLAFFASVVAEALYLLLFGSPSSDTAIGMALFIGVPMLIAFGTVKLFYKYEWAGARPTLTAQSNASSEANSGDA